MLTTLTRIEAPAYFQKYIALVEEEDICQALEESIDKLNLLLHCITAEDADYAYADDKWTLAQVLQHLIDCERIFSYRAMLIARNDGHNIIPFDENAYAAQAPAAHRSLYDLAQEMMLLRRSTLALFQSFTEEEMNRTGVLNGEKVSTNAFGFITLGHFQHHKNVLHERYGVCLQC